jgi:HlyD family secretion protein
MKKRIMLVLALGLLLGASGGGYWWYQRGAAAAAATPVYTHERVKRGPIRAEVSSSGSIVSNLDVEIKCKASGEIEQLPFDISDTIAEGDLLLELDPIDEERSVRQAEVRVLQSKARLEQARQNLTIAEATLRNSRMDVQATLQSAGAMAKDQREKAKRTAALLEKTYASPEEVESAESAAVQAEASLERARVGVESLGVDEQKLELLRQDIALAEADLVTDEISLDNAQQRLKETKVYAPMAGVLSDRMVQVGQIISSPTNNVSGGTALMTLSDLSRIFVLATVDESDIGKVRVGQPAQITVDAFPDDRFRGEVVRVATKGVVVSNVVTFEVKVEVLDESKTKLRPEMTADVDITAAEEESALLLPAAAVRGHGERAYVLKPVAGGEPERVPVRIGIQDGLNTQILSGLEENAEVLVSSEAGDGAWVRERGTNTGPPMGMMLGGPPRR